MLVEGLEVDAAARRAVVFPDDHHAVAPLRGFGHGLDDAHADVAVDVGFYLVLPVEGHGARR